MPYFSDESFMYMALAPVIRAVTPPPPDNEVDDFPSDPTLNCGWLEKPIMSNIPVKLVPHRRPLARPYHFKYLNSQFENGSSKIYAHLQNRGEEKILPLEALHWLPPTDINQTVVHVHGTDGQLYLMISVAGDACEVRKVPSRRNDPKYPFSRLELAQVNAARKGK